MTLRVDDVGRIDSSIRRAARSSSSEPTKAGPRGEPRGRRERAVNEMAAVGQKRRPGVTRFALAERGGRRSDATRGRDLLKASPAGRGKHDHAPWTPGSR